MTSSDRLKLVIDTDCGIDDALALMLALTEKEKAGVIAITCSFGNTSVENACSNVMRVLTLCGEKEIPVHRGCAGPLKKHKEIETVHGSDGLGNCASEFSTGDLAVNETPSSAALVQLARKYPNEITLIAIGPLTNLAIAHRLDEKFTENLKSIVIMGGNYKGIGNVTEVAEFNFFCDPDSAHIILTEAVCPITLVPWETTVQYGISWETYYEMIAVHSRKAHFMKQITRYSEKRGQKKGNPKYFDCDFLAVTAVLYPESVKQSFEAFAKVESRGEFTKGLTIVSTNDQFAVSLNKIKIITDFDIRFVDKLRLGMLDE